MIAVQTTSDVQVLTNPTRLIHYEHPEHEREAWCGASVQGVRTPGAPVECAVCADLWQQHRRMAEL